MSIDCACEVGIKMVNAVESLHELGYLHQDIKPENMVRRGNDVVLINMSQADNFLDAKGDHKSSDFKPKSSGSVLFMCLQSLKNK